MPKNDICTNRKTNKKKMSSENEIEKGNFRQSPKTAPPAFQNRYINKLIFVLGWK